MPTSEPLNVAFVWHMHQPDYRSASTGAFQMPWVRLHAIKDYLDMVQILAGYPAVHATINLVPCLVEQLEHYASGDFRDVYWEYTLKPAAELTLAERVFVVERLCERPDHPRALSHPRYLELAQKRAAQASAGWEACASAFTDDELRDLQVWFNLSWFDPDALAAEPLRDLVERGRHFGEADKDVLETVQAGLLAGTLPAYREAARSGQVELTTSPYFHPILPLLMNSDSARISAADTRLPPRRFAHPEDAVEQIESALLKHEHVFGETPRGMWCSEQAVGEDVIQLLIQTGLAWTISDETVLARSLSGAATPRGGSQVSPPRAHTRTTPAALAYAPYRLERDQGEMAIVFRDHTLSDLIGFAYRSWDSRDAAADLVRRLRQLRISLASSSARSAHPAPPLVTIALDGENAWEYYPRDGHDFLRYLYETLSADDSLRCVTVSEHLRDWPPDRSLDWLHTGSWIGGDLRTWSGDRAHNTAWDLLHQARDLAAARRRSSEPHTVAAWRHVQVAEGSDWFWWFGDHHHTELDHVWDRGFREHLQEVYRCLGERVPTELLLPILEQAAMEQPVLPTADIAPVINGLIDNLAEWDAAGRLAPDLPSTMERAEATHIVEVRFGWHSERLSLLVVPAASSALAGLEVEIRLSAPSQPEDTVVHLSLAENGLVEVSCTEGTGLSDQVQAAYDRVLEVSLLLAIPAVGPDGVGLVVRVGRGGITDRVFHSAGLESIGWGGQ